MDITKPEVDFPEGTPPETLEVTDIWEGNGKVIDAWRHRTGARHVEVAYSSGEEFDASWSRGEPLQFRLGVGQVIQGWDQGVQGMKVGDATASWSSRPTSATAAVARATPSSRARP